MLLNPTLKKRLWIAVLVLATLGLVAAIESRNAGRTCQHLTVVIDDQRPHHRFVTAAEVRHLLSNGGTRPVLGARLDRLDLRALEARVRSNGLIRACEIATDLSNTLTVRVWQQEPLARLIERRGVGNEADGYLNADGAFLPLSDHYTARVLLVSGPYFDKIPNLTAPRHAALLALLRYIAGDPFWNAQIAQVMVEQGGEVTLLPQVGNHRIEFGPPTEPEVKFKKLMVFYQRILPTKGWDTYARVSVKFKNQVVCLPAEKSD